MKWQDMVFTVGALVFSASLVATLLDENASMPLLTSVPTALFLYLYCYTFWTLGLRFSAVTALVNAVAWTLIALFRA